MPGVLIVEALAQAGGILAVESLGLGGSGKLVYFMGIDGVKFRKPVEPGVLLDLHVNILQAKRNICKFEGRAMLGDSLATERSEEHTSELQSLMRISYAVFCLKKKKIQKIIT